MRPLQVPPGLPAAARLHRPAGGLCAVRCVEPFYAVGAFRSPPFGCRSLLGCFMQSLAAATSTSRPIARAEKIARRAVGPSHEEHNSEVTETERRRRKRQARRVAEGHATCHETSRRESCGKVDAPVERFCADSSGRCDYRSQYRNPCSEAGIRLLKPKRTMGLEPTTPSLGSLSDGHDARRRPTTIACTRAGLRPLTARRPAWLREPFLRRLGQEWATAGVQLF